MSKITSAQDSETLLKTGVLQDAMFNSTAFSCIATDEKGVIQLFNAGAERMLGYDAADVLNKFTHDEISDSQELIDRAAALSLEFEMPIAPGFDALVFKASRGIEDIYKMTKVRKDGSRFPAIVSVTALRDVQKKIIGYLFIGTNNTAGTQVDATQARLAQQLREQPLRESEQRAQRILDTATDAFVAMDDAGRIKNWNGQAERFFGWSRQEVLGRDLADTIIPAKYHEAHRRGLQRFLATGEGTLLNKVIEVFARHRDGREIPVQLNIWTDSSSQGYAFNAFIHDV